jgi:hypothetical protein
MHYPYIRHLSLSEIDKTALITRPIARKVREAASRVKEIKGSGARILVFVDDKYSSTLDLARQMITEGKVKDDTPRDDTISTPADELSPEDYMKLSMLYEGNFKDKIIA